MSGGSIGSFAAGATLPDRTLEQHPGARLYRPPLLPFAERTTRPARRVVHWLWIRMPKQNGVTSDIAAVETNPDVGH